MVRRCINSDLQKRLIDIQNQLKELIINLLYKSDENDNEKQLSDAGETAELLINKFQSIPLEHPHDKFLSRRIPLEHPHD
ncbi:2226_t:CDS:1, partial [Racocetra persica]